MTAYLALAVIVPAVLHLFKFNVFAADPVQSQLPLSLRFSSICFGSFATTSLYLEWFKIKQSERTST